MVTPPGPASWPRVIGDRECLLVMEKLIPLQMCFEILFQENKEIREREKGMQDVFCV